MAACGFVGPGQWIVEWAGGAANHDVPQGKTTSRSQYPARLGVQARLVCDVHLDMLTDGGVESAVVKRKFGDVRLLDGDPTVQADESIEPAVCLAIFLRPIHGGNLAAELVG